MVEAEGPKRKGKAKAKEVDDSLLKGKRKGKSKGKGKGKKMAEEVIEEMIDEAVQAVNNEGLIRISRSGRLIKPAEKM